MWHIPTMGPSQRKNWRVLCFAFPEKHIAGYELFVGIPVEAETQEMLMRGCSRQRVFENVRRLYRIIPLEIRNQIRIHKFEFANYK